MHGEIIRWNTLLWWRTFFDNCPNSQFLYNRHLKSGQDEAIPEKGQAP